MWILWNSLVIKISISKSQKILSKVNFSQTKQFRNKTIKNKTKWKKQQPLFNLTSFIHNVSNDRYDN